MIVYDVMNSDNWTNILPSGFFFLTIQQTILIISSTTSPTMTIAPPTAAKIMVDVGKSVI